MAKDIVLADDLAFLILHSQVMSKYVFLAHSLHMALALYTDKAATHLEIGLCLYLDSTRGAQGNTSIRSWEFP